MAHQNRSVLPNQISCEFKDKKATVLFFLFFIYYLVLPNWFIFAIYQSRTVVKEKKLHCSLIAFLFKDSKLEQNVITTLLVSALIDIYVFMSTELPSTDWFMSGNYL